MSLTKKCISKKLSSDLNLSSNESEDFINSFFFSLAKNVSERETKIHNFGSFKIKNSKKRFGRNPKTMEEFVIKSRKKVSFSPSKLLRKKIN